MLKNIHKNKYLYDDNTTHKVYFYAVHFYLLS